MPGTPIGKLTDRIRIVRPVETQAADGQPVITEEAVAIVWARVNYVTGRESLGRGMIRATAGYTVETQFRQDVFDAGGKWSLEWLSKPGNGRRFGIASVAPDVPRRSMMTITCQTDADAAV